MFNKFFVYENYLANSKRCRKHYLPSSLLSSVFVALVESKRKLVSKEELY